MDKLPTIPSIAVSYLCGYVINSFGSWIESFFYYTWGGKPSIRLLRGKDIPKVRFYFWKEIKELLKSECKKDNPDENELFQIASRYAYSNSSVGSRIEYLNESYIFSRNILTWAIISLAFLLIKYNQNMYLYVVMIPLISVLWLRSKHRSYYFAREVLDCYLQSRTK
jgi:hypothetical protein